MTRKIIASVLLLVFTLSLGIVGYKVLVDTPVSVFDCVYMTIITISTVGFGETIDLTNNPAARTLTLVLILLGMGNLLFLISTFTSILVDGELKKFFRRLSLMRTISSYEQHFIICGAGNTGIHMIKELVTTKRPFVVIDSDAATVEQLTSQFDNVVVLVGDATHDELLLEAGIKKAGSLASVLPTDKDNLFLTVTAKQLNPNLRIVSKITSLENRTKMIRAGATSVVSPNFIGALRIASELVRPKVVTFLDVMLRDTRNIRVEEVDIAPESWTIHKTLKDIRIPQKVGLQIIAAKHDTETDFNYTPRGSFQIEANTTLIVIGTPEKINNLREFVT